MFWRARLIKSEIYSNISDLDYPPPELARQGGLNDRDTPVSTFETALAEVDAMEGQLVQLAGFRVKNESPIRLAVIGKYANVQKKEWIHAFRWPRSRMPQLTEIRVQSRPSSIYLLESRR
jgi:hypothetical protein